MLYPPVNGGYTELFAAISPDVDLNTNGSYIYPFGRFGGVKKLDQAIKRKNEGGTGAAELFWNWTEKTVQKYM